MMDNSYMYGGGGGGGGYGGGGSNMVMPPVAWLYQDWNAAVDACPVLLYLCAAVVAGYVLQNFFARCFSFQRVAVFYPPTLKAGEVWRLFSHVLLHADMGHLLVNLLHILNTLDLEGVPYGSGYPSGYALGSSHTMKIVATSAAYGALIGSVPYFGAMFEGVSSVCFGLDGALFAACGLLLGSNAADPSLASFLQIRGFYAAVHMGIDLMRGCGAGSTVGNLSHLAGFVGGFCYVLSLMPAVGGRPVPTFPCLVQAGGHWDQGRCIALFDTRYSCTVQKAQFWASVVLAAGPVLALLNAFVVHKSAHASADGYSVLVKPSAGGMRGNTAGGGQRLGGHQDSSLQNAMAASMRSYEEEQARRTGR
eukprot:TRINITY_DN9680_c0_g1_i3.p1 TRINITY_DN9680_c0_g1~~TRINITY_DN9680_c0_g1_i3.p1  ORF type:complete len:364 (+),score=59.23 TRINITY_DN9680_c0_g1_i3:186-1277(+)